MPRLIERAYWNAFVLWHARNETRLPFWPLERIFEIQNRRVRAMVKHAYETVPFYHDAMDAARLRPSDFRSASDLCKLPLLTSEQVVRAPEQFLSRRFSRGSVRRLESSGTIGIQKSVYYDSRALMLALAYGHRQRVVLSRFIGNTFGYRELSFLRPEGTWQRIRRFYASHLLIPRRLDYEREFVTSSQTVEESIAAINRCAPDVVFGYGSHLGLIFRQARRKNLELVKPKVIYYAADSMPEADKQLIETEFGLPVYSTYQAVEALRIAFQCERRAGFHISLDQVAVRVVDEHGDPVSNGKPGEIVISNLTNRATVLLNYKLGDVVTYTDHLCECRRTLPMINGIQGRANDIVVLSDGRIIHSLSLLPQLQAVDGVIQLQITQTDPICFLIKAVCSSTADWENTRRELEKRARAALGEGISFDISNVETIPSEASGKVRAVISHCRE